MQLYRYYVSQLSEFCRHNPLCCFSTRFIIIIIIIIIAAAALFRYRLSPETFVYTLV
jgi:hypothetical protein